MARAPGSGLVHRDCAARPHCVLQTGGVADLDNNVPARMDTVYNMGSVSRVNTTVAAMQLYEAGKIRAAVAYQETYCDYILKQALCVERVPKVDAQVIQERVN